MTVDTILVRDREPTTTIVGGEILMLSLRTGTYFGLNKVSSEIWEILAEPCSVGQVCRVLSQRYDADSGLIAHEVSAFLQEMLEKGLVRVAD